jgi:thioredoxin-like negative regulator of GroEL
VNPEVTGGDRPRLVYFYSPTSGPARRVEGYLSQVLQRRQNHETFLVTRISVDARADLVERFDVRLIPSILVIEGRRVSARIDGARGRREIEETLAPWLR